MRHVKKQACTHSVQTGLLAGEGEGEAKGKTSVLHPHVVQEVTDTLHYVVKQLEHNENMIQFTLHCILLRFTSCRREERPNFFFTRELI